MAKNKYDKNQLNNNIKINKNKTLIKDRNIINYRKIKNIGAIKKEISWNGLKRINKDENINRNYKLEHNDYYFDDNITSNDLEKTLIKRNKSLNPIPLLNSSKQNLNKKEIFSNICKYNLKMKTPKRKSLIFNNNKNNLDKKELNNNELFYNNINSSSTENIPSISDKNNNNNQLKNKTLIKLRKQLKKINIIKFENNEILDLNSNSKRSYSFNNILSGKNREKNRNYHLSYVPFNIMSAKGKLQSKSQSSLNKEDLKDINNIGLNSPIEKKKYLNLYNVHTRRYKIDEEKNIISYRNIKKKNMKDINNGIANININKALDNKDISINEIKNYYIDKKRDYSSLIHDKEKSNIFIKKFRRKYKINTSLIFNQKNQNKISILPKINKKYNF